MQTVLRFYSTVKKTKSLQDKQVQFYMGKVGRKLPEPLQMARLVVLLLEQIPTNFKKCAIIYAVISFLLQTCRGTCGK